MEIMMLEPSFQQRMSEYFASQGKPLPNYYKEYPEEMYPLKPTMPKKKKKKNNRVFSLFKKRKQVIIKSTSISSLSSNDELLERYSI